MARRSKQAHAGGGAPARRGNPGIPPRGAGVPAQAGAMPPAAPMGQAAQMMANPALLSAILGMKGRAGGGPMGGGPGGAGGGVPPPPV